MSNGVRFVIPALVLMVSCRGSPEDEFIETALCARCQLELQRDLRLNPVDQQVRFLISSKLVKSESGLIYAAPLVGRSQVAVFSPAASFVGTFGTQGSGPGELEGIAHISMGAGDSIFALDQRGKLEIFTPDREAARSVQIGALATIHELPSGRLVIAPRGLGSPVLLSERDGGTRIQVEHPMHEEASRTVRVAPDGTIWSVSGTYQIEAYGDSGELLHQANLSRTFGAPDDRYRYRVIDVAIPTSDRLFVLVSRRDLEWRPEPASEADAPAMLSVEEATELSQFYLDVVDWQTGELLARTPLEDKFVGGLLGSDQLYTVETGSDYELWLQTWQIGFDRTTAAPL